MLRCLCVEQPGTGTRGSGHSTIDVSYRPKKNSTILALSEDRDLVELLVRNCVRPWKVKAVGDFVSHLDLIPNSECKVVVVEDEKLLQADRGWLLNKIQNRIPQAFIVYIASQHSPEVERMARTRGAGYYLSKPVDSERLTHLLLGLQRMNST